MGVDGDLTSIIREIVQFLELLCDVDLPLKIENARTNLLQRSRIKLATMSTRGSTSPEPYLDMNAGKGFLFFTKKKNRDIETEEYVGIEENPDLTVKTMNQDYYETFQEINGTDDSTSYANLDNPGRSKYKNLTLTRDEQFENKLRDIYRTFTAAKTMSKAHKYGPLYYKVERKPFGFVRANIRLCWIGLVGSHLLIHGSEDDKQTPEVLSIRGYSARPAPSSISRDPERAKSAFEIFCPGNKTLQFIAKSPKEMEEWLEAISRIGTKTREDTDEISGEEVIVEERGESSSIEEKYQDVGEVILVTKTKESPILSIVDQSNDNETKKFDTTRNSIILTTAVPPILPARMAPRCLPSLPTEARPLSSYEPLDDGYEEDDIYHKIEDYRENGRSYENVKKSKKKFTRNKKNKRKPDVLQTETYDDVVERKDSIRKKEENMETYDDVRSVIEDKKISTLLDNNSISSKKNIRQDSNGGVGIEDQYFESYDDVAQSSSTLINHSSGKTKTDESKDSKQTKSEKCPTKMEKSPTKSDKSLTKSEKSPTKSEKSPTKSEKSLTKLDKNPMKSSQKRSFLDRVRHRKDSPKKDEKKCSKELMYDGKSEKEKKNISMESSETFEPKNIQNIDLPYDDVTELTNDNENSRNENHQWSEEISNYNCPPPPRPIYSKPSSPIVAIIEKNNEISSIDEVYDDIGNYREKITEPPIKEEKIVSRDNKDEKKVKNNLGYNSRIDERFSVITNDDEKKNSFECEHYQTPRTDSIKVNLPIIQTEEQLYDDIAILTNFSSKQRDSSSVSNSPKKSSSSSIIEIDEKLTTSPKKSWSRFGSVKKNRESSSFPQSSSTKNKFSLNLDYPDNDSDFPVDDKQDNVKVNKLQKLINKMECTLGKQPSTKSVEIKKKKNDQNESGLVRKT